MHPDVEPVELAALTEDTLAALLDAAVADADPLEVMPPVAGEPGWTAARRQAFLAFHRSRALRSDPVEYTYPITVGGRVVGAARLQPGTDGFEAGVWIGRSYRGRGVGRAVAELLRAAAAELGAQRIAAVTTVDNHAARALLGSWTPTIDGDSVTAFIELGQDPRTAGVGDVATN